MRFMLAMLLGAIATVGLVACSNDGGTGDSAEVAPTSGGESESQPTVRLSERASEATERALVDLEQRVANIETALATLAQGGFPDLFGRVRDLESQVGVSSVHRRSVSDLWSEVAGLRRCVEAMRQSWSTQFAPVC